MQASNALQLFNFVSADINSYQPKGLPSTDISSAMEDLSGSSEPSFPKSLYIIGPLFGSHELNTIANGAQASIPAPEGLDLDAWIVPLRDPSPQPQQETEEVAKKKKGRKGKGKAVGSSVDGKKKSKGNEHMLAPVGSDYETLEDKAIREQVRTHLLLKGDAFNESLLRERQKGLLSCGMIHTI